MVSGASRQAVAADGRAARGGGGWAVEGIDREFEGTAPRDAVEDDGTAGFGGNGFEMLEQPVLGRFVIIGRHLQRTVRARVFGPFRQINGFGGRVASAARK